MRGDIRFGVFSDSVLGRGLMRAANDDGVLVDALIRKVLSDWLTENGYTDQVQDELNVEARRSRANRRVSRRR